MPNNVFMILTCLWPSAQFWSFECFLFINQQVWMKLLFNRTCFFAVECSFYLKQLSVVMAGSLLFIISSSFPTDWVFDPNFRILRVTALMKKDRMAEMAVRLRAAGQVIRLMVTLKETCCQDLRSQSSIHPDPEWRPDSSFSLREIISKGVMTTALYSLGTTPEHEHSIFTTCSCQQRFPSVIFSTKMEPHLPITKCAIAPPAGSGLYHLCMVLSNLLFTGSDSFYRALLISFHFW